MYRIYTLLFRVGLVVASPYYLIRFRKYLPTFAERLGFLKIPQLNNGIWIHAVSVGEVRSVEHLIERIGQQFPLHPVAVSTTTAAGQQLARERRDIIDHTFYFPLDIPRAVKRTLDRVRPRLVIITETEIWPNFLRECRRRNIPVMMINGRISDRSFPRYQAVRVWLARVLDDYAILGMQSEIDRGRIEAIGANPQRVAVFGNLKYDIVPSAKPLDPSLRTFLRNWSEIWIAASTMPGEEEFVLRAFRDLKRSHPLLKLVLAPRHPERFDAVASLVESRGLSCLRRSRFSGESDVLLLDTIGELAAAFEFATVVFMGGTLVRRGGHNILEPARHARPIIFGPHMENFRDIARLFLESNAAVQIRKPSDLAPAVKRVLSEPAYAESLGQRAKQLLAHNAGATDRILSFMYERIFRPVTVGAGR
jgi:3-deoxy-D-manno-octulosonic-acid transferase